MKAVRRVFGAWLWSALVLFGAPGELVAAQPVAVQPPSREASGEALRRCLLEYVQPARSALAAESLQRACARRFPREPADSAALEIRPEREDELMAYDQCLFQHLPGVHTDPSAQSMERFCHDQFHPGESASERSAPASDMLNWLQRLDGTVKTQQSPTAAPRIEGDTFVPLTPAKGGR
ncbi:MAG: hypothetical protein HQM00_07115 [Magnetococcales bacterium]|nr:hypothetical protein [Magnetococcales bacterium]